MNTEIITSRQNPRVMRAASLAEKKYRDAHGLFLIEGEKLLLEAFDAGVLPQEIFVSESVAEKYLPLIFQKAEQTKKDEISVFVLSEAAFQKISTEKAPQGVIGVARHLDFFKKYIKIDGRVLYQPEDHVLVLYDVRDPGNLGAVLRSALAFGVDRVILAGHCADLYHPKTVRAAMGALFRLSFAYAEDMNLLVRSLHDAGRRLLAAELTEGALSLDEAGLTQQDVCVIGNEGHGIPREISAMCDTSIYIPISPLSESLNASVAASILIWEQSRK